jgi:plasmid stabilization system protein ParE
MSRVVRPASIRADLKDIGRYIAQQSQSLDLALQFLDRVDDKCNLYASHPEMGTSRTDLGPKVRCFPVSD